MEFKATTDWKNKENKQGHVVVVDLSLLIVVMKELLSLLHL